MRKTITKVVLIICAVSVALGIALCASGVVMGADVEKALRGIGINYDEHREMVGYTVLNTEFSQARALTKNYGEEGNGNAA